MRTASPTKVAVVPPPAIRAPRPIMRSMLGGSRRPKRAKRAVSAPPVMRGRMTKVKTLRGWRLA